MKPPLVSIQIPTYNQKQYIKDALNSALEQTYENLQIIVADDCSPDYDIFEYLKEYRDNSKVIIYRNDRNLGRVGNYRNSLYNLVTGQWFVNLDGDDFFTDPNFLSHAVEAIGNCEHDVVAFKANSPLNIIRDHNIPHDSLSDSTVIIKSSDYLFHLGKGLGFMHAAILFNVAKAKNSNFYNINILDSDYFSFLKILRNGTIILCDKSVYHWRQHEIQATYSLDFHQVKAKYEALQDLKYHYLPIRDASNSRMIRVTERNLFVQLMTTFYRGKKTLLKFTFLLSRIRFRKEFAEIFLLKIKNTFFTF